MSSKQSTVDFFVDQMSLAGEIRYRKMFGEYAIYCDNKVVALVCNEKLYIKPTEAGERLIDKIILEPPYPGAKPYFYISGDLAEDKIWLSQLVGETAALLPLPKVKVVNK